LSQPTDRRCVEFRAVFSDGTVERWEGDVATRVWAACDWSWLDKGEKPTVTRPHRKVTVLCGCHYDAALDGEGIADRDVVLTYHLGRQILPPEALGETDGANGPLFDYRIEVEAVLAKEENP
jgi:hypothetical protein